MSGISENVASVLARVASAAAAAGRDPSEITVIAASKMNDAQSIREAFASGIKIFGYSSPLKQIISELDPAHLILIFDLLLS